MAGKVGMFGISWGGFNSIQLAMRHPPALKAILAVDATEQLFHDDVHYIDGMMHFDEFELNMDLAPSMTGAPDYTLDEKILGPRFESAPWSLTYFKHQRDGQFWHAPVRPLSEIKIPCFLIGGLLDGYRDSIPRMFEQVKAPVKAILGPWTHTFPNDAEPGPKSNGVIKPSAGGIPGSRTATQELWKNRRYRFTCRSGTLPILI